MSELLPEPSPPEDWECCGSECGDYCVFEIYRREKQAYDEQQQYIQQQTQQQNLIENAQKYFYIVIILLKYAKF